MCMGGNSNAFEIENLVNLWNKFKSLVLIYVYKYYFGLICSGEKVTSLADILQWKKAIYKIIFWHKTFTC